METEPGGSVNFTWPISAAALAQGKRLILRWSARPVENRSHTLQCRAFWFFHLRIFGLGFVLPPVSGGPAQMPKWAKSERRNHQATCYSTTSLHIRPRMSAISSPSIFTDASTLRPPTRLGESSRVVVRKNPATRRPSRRLHFRCRPRQKTPPLPSPLFQISQALLLAYTNPSRRIRPNKIAGTAY